VSPSCPRTFSLLAEFEEKDVNLPVEGRGLRILGKLVVRYVCWLGSGHASWIEGGVKCGGLRILGTLVGHCYVCWFRSGHVGRFEKEG
jgi:hypothetical protein